jgi:TPP-dependent pyruvate/acetoin dehydrogenase alpha subunit
MATMREVEDRIERKLYRQGKIMGGVYVGRGQEAIPVGVGLTA